jgi:hypothetical protein
LEDEIDRQNGIESEQMIKAFETTFRDPGALVAGALYAGATSVGTFSNVVRIANNVSHSSL